MSLKGKGGKHANELCRCDVHDAQRDGHGGTCKVNTIMKLWHHLPESGKCFHFGYLVESDDFHEPMAATNAVLSALWPVVRPLSVTLEMAAMLRDLPLIDHKILLPISTWHLREVEVPAHIPIAAWVQASDPSQHSEEARLHLTPQALADWLARAHAQQLPEGYVPTLYCMHMYFTRARFLQDQKPYAELVLGPKTYVIPVEKREDGLWVSGPMRDTRTKPPIKIFLVHDGGRMGLDISVYWSPWIEAGSAEAELLRSCLRELEKQGWKDEKEATDWLRRT